MVWRAVRAGYGSPKTVNESWSYDDLLEMIYFDDLSAIHDHIEYQEYEQKQKLLDEALS